MSPTHNPPHLVFGAGGIGNSPGSFTFTWDTPAKVDELFTALERLDVRELDSAASYPPGNPWNTETLLGQSDAVARGFVVDSKIAGHLPSPRLDAKTIAESIDKTLELVRAPKVRTMYIHVPDPDSPMEETAAAFDKQYKAGKFEKLGICNYSAADLAKYFDICEAKGYVKPSVIQGLYNAVYREWETELFPLLRKHNCVFYAYSPLAGGFLTGKLTFPPAGEDNALKGTRWRGESTMPVYPKLFDTPPMHDAMKLLKAACDAASPPMSLQEASLRWLMHHSALREGDAIILGAKRIDQLEANVADARKGPLPQAVVDVFDKIHGIVADQPKLLSSF